MIYRGNFNTNGSATMFLASTPLRLCVTPWNGLFRQTNRYICVLEQLARWQLTSATRPALTTKVLLQMVRMPAPVRLTCHDAWDSRRVDAFMPGTHDALCPEKAHRRQLYRAAGGLGLCEHPRVCLLCRPAS